MQYLKSIFGFITLILLIASCNPRYNNSAEELNNASSNRSEVPVNIQIKLTGKHIGSSRLKNGLNTNQLEQALFSGSNIQVATISYFIGNLTITDQSDLSNFKTYEVTASINNSSFDANLLQNFVLKPGTYTFTLSLVRSDQQYAGNTVATINATTGNEGNIIPLSISPVIGDTIVTTTIVDQLGHLTFNYPEIPHLIEDPSNDEIKIGVVIDNSGDERYLQFNNSGESESYIILNDEPNKIELKLYKNSRQIGKSRSDQEEPPGGFKFGQNIYIDLIPLYSRTALRLSEDGGDATFDVIFPREIVDNGSNTLENLKVNLAFTGNKNNQSGSLEGTEFILDTSTGMYIGGSLNFSNVFYDNINIYVSYKTKGVDTQLIGACNYQLALRSNNTHYAYCNISVENSISQSGSIVGLANIIVKEPTLSPVSGASVYIKKVGGEEETVGITDKNGHIVTYLKAGDYNFGARLFSNGRYGETGIITIDTLAVENIDIILNASQPVSGTALINGGKAATYSKYVTLSLSAQDDDKITAYYLSENPTVPNPGETGWKTISDQTSDYFGTAPFTLPDGDGTKTVYAWFKNPSNAVSQGVSDSIILKKYTGVSQLNFGVTNDTTSDSGNLDLHCSNQLGPGYRLADWNDILAYTDGSVSKGLIISNNFGLPPNSINDKDMSNKLFVSFNGNRYLGSGNRHMYISRFNEHTNPVIHTYDPIDHIQITSSGYWKDYLYLIAETESLWIHEVGNLTVKVACFTDTSYQPLLNGTFDDPDDNEKYWGHVGNAYTSVINNELILENHTDFDAIRRQDNIGVIEGKTYLLSAQLKTSTDDAEVLIRVEDASGNVLVNLSTTANTYQTFSGSFDVDNTVALPLSTIITLPAGSTGNGFADDITLTVQ